MRRPSPWSASSTSSGFAARHRRADRRRRGAVVPEQHLHVHAEARPGVVYRARAGAGARRSRRPRRVVPASRAAFPRRRGRRRPRCRFRSGTSTARGSRPRGAASSATASRPPIRQSAAPIFDPAGRETRPPPIAAAARATDEVDAQEFPAATDDPGDAHLLVHRAGDRVRGDLRPFLGDGGERVFTVAFRRGTRWHLADEVEDSGRRDGHGGADLRPTTRSRPRRPAPNPGRAPARRGGPRAGPRAGGCRPRRAGRPPPSSVFSSPSFIRRAREVWRSSSTKSLANPRSRNARRPSVVARTASFVRTVRWNAAIFAPSRPGTTNRVTVSEESRRKNATTGSSPTAKASMRYSSTPSPRRVPSTGTRPATGCALHARRREQWHHRGEEEREDPHDGDDHEHAARADHAAGEAGRRRSRSSPSCAGRGRGARRRRTASRGSARSRTPRSHPTRRMASGPRAGGAERYRPRNDVGRAAPSGPPWKEDQRRSRVYQEGSVARELRPLCRHDRGGQRDVAVLRPRPPVPASTARRRGTRAPRAGERLAGRLVHVDVAARARCRTCPSRRSRRWPRRASRPCRRSERRARRRSCSRCRCSRCRRGPR